MKNSFNKFQSIFSRKTILVTGHTGFKGSWLCQWLLKLDAKVVGISNEVPTTPSHFNSIQLSKRIQDIRLDVRNREKINDIVVNQIEPDFIFHLAAQPLVRRSYEDPILTWETNTLGTVNMLNALCNISKKCTAVFITSDKCYDNVEWTWGYRETDKIGGIDPYSASKGGAELAIRSYANSFFKDNHNVRIGIGRAGNVIGGGDWAIDRIVPDSIISWSKKDVLKLRNPNSTRPWQHVLEPLSGYLTLAVNLYEDKLLHGEAFNFGPPSNQNYSVEELVKEMAKHWSSAKYENITISQNAPEECGLLKLNCDKALHKLNWEPKWNFEETVKKTVNWYSNFYNQQSVDPEVITSKQIDDYMYC